MSTIQKSVLLPFDKYQRLIDQTRDTYFDGVVKKTRIRQPSVVNPQPTKPREQPGPPGTPASKQRQPKKISRKVWIEV